MKINKRRLEKELRYLLSTSHLPITISHFYKHSKEIALKEFEEYKTSKIRMYNVVSLNIKLYGKASYYAYMKFFKIFNIAEILEITNDELCLLWINERGNVREKKDVYQQTPIKEGRDNKGVYVGNGGSNSNKVRYPSKKRSLRTWKIFYKMFPYYAEKDGWDGKTSKKM